MAKFLTDAAVRKYRGGRRRREIRDGGAQGLYLVVQPSGAKSWALRYRRPDGKAAKLTLGAVDFSGREPKEGPVLGACFQILPGPVPLAVLTFAQWLQAELLCAPRDLGAEVVSTSIRPSEDAAGKSNSDKR